METLLTITNILFEPDERLLLTAHFPLSFIEAFITSIFFTNLFSITSNINQKFIYSTLFAIFSTVFKYLLPMPYEIFLSIFIILILIKFIFKINFFKSTLCLIVPVIFTTIIEIIILPVSYRFLNISFAKIWNIPIYGIGVHLFTCFLTFGANLLIEKFNIHFNILDHFNLTDKTNLIFIGILGLTAVYLNLYVVFYYYNYLPNYISIIGILVLVMYFIINLYCLIKSINLEVAKQNIENLQLYNKTLDVMDDNVRAFRHDMNNIMQSIGGYIETEDLIGLKRYYKDLVKDCYSVTNLDTLRPEIINNPSVYNLLLSKYHKAYSKNIQINFDICIDLNSLNITTYELTRMLGILLDNSIEAAEECNEKVINVRFQNDINRTCQLVIIENTYMDKDVDTVKIFEKSYTSKQNNTGLGLWEVNKLLNKHTNLGLFTTKSNKYFTQQLEIY